MMKVTKEVFFGVRMTKAEEQRLKGLAEVLGVSSGEAIRRLVRNAKVSTVQRVDADLGAGGSG